MNFDALWKSGHWRKNGRLEAERRFRAQIKTEADWKLILAARDAYNEYCEANRWYTPVLGSVWFGRRKGWRDWIPDDEFEARADDREPAPLFAQAEREADLLERATLVHHQLQRDRAGWLLDRALHQHNVACPVNCPFRKEPEVPTLDYILARMREL